MVDPHPEPPGGPSVQGDMLVAEMLAKLFKRKAEKEGIPDSPDLRAAFLHEVWRLPNQLQTLSPKP